jgi:hypothetical protein
MNVEGAAGFDAHARVDALEQRVVRIDHHLITLARRRSSACVLTVTGHALLAPGHERLLAVRDLADEEPGGHGAPILWSRQTERSSHLTHKRSWPLFAKMYAVELLPNFSLGAGLSREGVHKAPISARSRPFGKLTLARESKPSS